MQIIILKNCLIQIIMIKKKKKLFKEEELLEIQIIVQILNLII